MHSLNRLFSRQIPFPKWIDESMIVLHCQFPTNSNQFLFCNFQFNSLLVGLPRLIVSIPLQYYFFFPFPPQFQFRRQCWFCPFLGLLHLPQLLRCFVPVAVFSSFVLISSFCSSRQLPTKNSIQFSF